MITKQEMIDFCEIGRNNPLLSEGTQDMFAAIEDILRENSNIEAKWERIPNSFLFECTACKNITAIRGGYCTYCGARMSRI